MPTLDTINGKGEAVVESRIVVDHTEADGNGFLIDAIGNDRTQWMSFGLK